MARKPPLDIKEGRRAIAHYVEEFDFDLHKGDFCLEVSSPSLGSFGGPIINSPHIQA